MQMSDRIGRRLKLHDLHVLMAVVQAGSMNKAAKILNTTQPNVSRSIADLEHVVGVRLLDRNRAGIEPTAYGRALLDGGTAAFDELRQAMTNIEFLTDPGAGEVRIGSSTPLATSFVSAVIAQLSRRYPRIEFHVIAAPQEILYRELRERHVDLLISRRFGPVIDDRLEFEFLFDNSIVVVAGAQNPWARRRKIELAELVNESWAMPPPESAVGTLFGEAFRSNGLHYPRTTVIASMPEVRFSLAVTGLFLTMVSASVLKFPAQRPEIKVLPVKLPTARVPIGIITLKSRTLSPVVKLFIEHAREVARPLASHKQVKP